jgi:hypothetical protein
MTETFDVLSFIQQTHYPESKVVLFQDANSAFRYTKIVDKRVPLDKEGADTTDIDKQIDELGDKIRKSSIIVHLKGMPPGIVQEIMGKEADDTAKDNELIALTITKVTNHEGVEDTRTWDDAAVAQLRKFLKEGEFRKLVQEVAEVNLNAAIFDQATDAGFSSGDSDLAE